MFYSMLLLLTAGQIDYGAALGTRSVDAANRSAAELMAEQAKAIRLANDRAEMENQRADLPLRVGRMVSQGKCEAAIDAALKGGDLQLATQTKEFCAKP